MVDKRYEAKVTKEIHEYLRRFGPASTRAITEDLNQRYKGNLTTNDILYLLKKEENNGRIFRAEVLSKMIIWGTVQERF